MFKKTGYTLALLALAAVPFITHSQPQEVIAAPDCSDGFPRPLCPIWDVEFKAGTSMFVSCKTGGQWKCALKLL